MERMHDEKQQQCLRFVIAVAVKVTVKERLHNIKMHDTNYFTKQASREDQESFHTKIYGMNNFTKLISRPFTCRQDEQKLYPTHTLSLTPTHPHSLSQT